MATAAKTSPLTTVPYFAEGEQEQQKLQEIQELQRKLLQAYEARPLFDPTLLAMARGFGAPSRTGSFFESLGNVAGELGPVQEAQQQRAQELAAMRLQLAQAELGGLQQARGQKKFAEFVNRLEPEAPGAAPAEGTPAEGTTAPGVKVTPEGVSTPASRAVTPRDIAMLKSIPGMESKAKILEDMVKQEQDRFTISMQGIVFDKSRGRYLDLDIPGQKQEKFVTPYGAFLMTPNEYAKFSNAQRSGKGEEWIANFRKGASGAVAPTATELEEQQAAAAERGKERAKAETGRTQEAIAGAGDVTSRLGTYNILETIARKRDADKIFGILANPDVVSGITKLVQTGIGVKGYTIGIPEIQNVLRNLNLPKEQISDAQLALSLIAEAQLQASRLGKGQGSVSNFERTLFAEASLSMDDRPETILRKVAMLRARAELDREVSRALRKTKMEYDDFRDTPQYEDLVKKYDQKLYEVARGVPSSGLPTAPAGKWSVER